MQDLAGDGERQCDDFAFDAVVVILPFECKLLEPTADLVAILGQGSVEFGTEFLLPALPSLLEDLGLLAEISFFGRLAGIGRAAHSPPWESDFGIGEWRGFGDGLPLGGARRHTPPATRRSTPACPPLRVGVPLPQFRVGLDSRPWTAPGPIPPCLPSACRRRATTST